MFDIVEPYSGHFLDAEWLEYDEVNKTFKRPVHIKIKPKSDSSKGVSLGTKELISVRENGRWIEKSVFKIHVVDKHKYKGRDKVRILYEDKTYVVAKIGENIDHPNTIKYMMFPNLKTEFPSILYLGDS